MPTGTRGVVGGVMNGASSRIDVNAATIASFTGNPNTTNAFAGGLVVGTNNAQSAARFANMEFQDHVLFNTSHSQVVSQADCATVRAAEGF